MTLHFSPDFWLSRAGLLNGGAEPPSSGRGGWTGHEADESPAELLEYAETLPRLESLDVPGREPAAVFVPERYEPNYAYPLLVWLHNGAAGERDLEGLMTRISTQNLLAVTVACPELSAPLVPGALDGLVDEIGGTLRALRREYHVHSERVYPIGFGVGASLALGLLLARPALFGGAVSLCGCFPNSRQPLFRFRELSRKPVLMAGGARDETVPVTEIVRSGRMLHAAGMAITTRIYDAAHEMTARMLRDVDRWILGGIGAVAA